MDLEGIKLILNGPDYLHANPQWCRDALVFLVDRVEKLEQKNNKKISVEPICDHQFEHDHKVVYCEKCGWTEEVY